MLNQPLNHPFTKLAHALGRLSREFLSLSRTLKAPALGNYLLCCIRTAPRIYAAKKLAPADHLMGGTLKVVFHGAEIVVDLDGIDSMIPGDTPTFAGIREMYSRDVYLKHFDMSRIDMINVIDAGANRGLFTAYAAKCAQKVVWIEAQPKYVGALNVLIAGNSLQEKVERREGILVGGKDSLPASWKLKMFRLTDFTDIAYTIDEIMARHNMNHISFLKMDVEGAEFSIFENPGHWIGALQNLAMEVHPEGGEPARIVECLAKHGFEVMTCNAELLPCAATQASYIYASRTGALRRNVQIDSSAGKEGS
jgi:FkbM family methyltransferase